MTRVGPPPLVTRIAVRAFFVVVWRHLPRTDVRGEDAERGLEEPRPPDPLLWSDQSKRPSLEDEQLELRPGDEPSRPVGGRPEVGEGRPAEPIVEVGIHGSARMTAPFVHFKPWGQPPTFIAAGCRRLVEAIGRGDVEDHPPTGAVASVGGPARANTHPQGAQPCVAGAADAPLAGPGDPARRARADGR